MTAFVRVGDVLRLERRRIDVDPTGEYREIGVRSFGKGIFHKEPVTGDELGNKRVFSINPGDLVLSNVFAWEGAVALAQETERGMIGSHRFMTYVASDDRLLPAWASWFFASEPGLDLLRAASPGSAGRNRTLAIERFENLEIPLPSLDDQLRTARGLSLLRERVRALHQLADRAEKITSALPASLALRPDFTDPQRLRKRWRLLPLGETMQASTSQVQVDNDLTYQVAGIYSFGKGLIDRGPMSGSDTSYKSFTRLATGDVALSKLNGWEGAVAVVPPAFDGFFVSTEYPVFKLDQSIMIPGYFDGVARSPSFWDELDRKARGSMVRRRRINPAEFLRATVWVPPIEDQHHIASVLASVEDLPEHRRRAGDRLNALLSAALNEAFSGS